ncbi:hypothetical protein IAU60_006408 [Kwoniella sp. DSM 27419]
MSRRPTTTTARATVMRTASSASISMPPPSRIPNRPPSAAATTARNGAAAPVVADEASASRSSSPSRRSRKPSASGKKETLATDGNGEINIQVVVRCRGRSAQEVASASPIITTTSGAIAKSITVETTPLTSSSLSYTTASTYGGSHQPSTKTYPFDKVFGPEADQTMVFNEVADGMLDEVLAGYNCTIFAYGQTGTGKTYTMQGDLELTNLNKPKSTAGIVPRVLHRLFSLLENSDNTEFSVKCSYVELYNEELRDLLATEYKGDHLTQQQQQQNGTSTGGGLKLYEDGKKGTNIQGLEETGVRSLKEALNLLDKGVKRRQTAETKMNTESSRSHTIFSITVHVKESNMQRGGEDLLKVGKFNLVDLAGSEAIGRSGATDRRAREAGMINQSLLTLGRVISALVEKGSHIPYRESKLTRLLQDSLGGRTKTCIVATVSPTRSNMEETLSTLDYAIRAKSIRNRPEVNAHMTKTGLLKEYVGDIERLKAELLASREKNGIYIPEDQWKEMQEAQIKQKSDFDEAVLKAGMIEVELATKKQEFDEVSDKLLATEEDLLQVREAERQLTELLEETKVVLERVKVELQEEAVVSNAYKRGEDRLDQVAGGLSRVAKESVHDVGGLFDKLARKAKVLGSNADAATVFGSDMLKLSGDLRAGLGQLHDAHDNFSRGVRAEMEEYAQRGQEASQVDQQALDRSFSAFNDLAKRLSASNEKGQREAAESSKAILAVKEAVQSSVQDWAKGVSERSERMVGESLEHQQEHLDTVGSVLGSTADLVDAVISTTLSHLSAERQAGQRARDLALRSSSAEATRLQEQNSLLIKLLVEEKAKNARLRTELIGNFTKMIEGFTDAQDESLTSVMGQIRQENERAVEGLQVFGTEVQHGWEEGEKARGVVEAELRMGGETSRKQRESGASALGSVREGLRERLQVYGRELTSEADAQVKTVDGFCAKLGKSANDVSSKASSRAKKHADFLSAMAANVGQTHQTSKTRSTEVAEGIASMSSALISSQAQVAASFSEAHQGSTSRLDDIISSTSSFLERGIQEDTPTGITPRKKVWNVQTEWERTGSREAVLASWRQRVAAGEGEDVDAEPVRPGVAAVEQADDPENQDVPSEEVTSVAGSLNASAPQSRESTPPLTGIPVTRNALSLSQSQNGHHANNGTMRPPSGLPVGKGKSLSMGGKKMAAMMEERPVIVPLGEGVGANVPRRTRK